MKDEHLEQVKVFGQLEAQFELFKVNFEDFENSLTKNRDGLEEAS